jgi:hypothetical protein
MLTLTQLAGFGGGDSGPDFIPNAVNWDDIFATPSGSNGDQTIGGIDQPITLKFTASDILGDGTLRVRQVVNGVNGNLLTISGGASQSFTVVNGDTVRFFATISGLLGSMMDCTITVTNESNGSATIDSFFISAEV